MIRMVFPIDDFLAYFPEFLSSDKIKVQATGLRAQMHIGESAPGMPLEGERRFYALFLATAHLLTLDKMSDGEGGEGSDMAGTPFKATIGSVQIENTKQNSFTADDWTFWYNQTKYGRELLAYLYEIQGLGIFLNTSKDSVRDLV